MTQSNTPEVLSPGSDIRNRHHLLAEEYSLLFRSFFRVRENPFNNTPDPNYFYMSPSHQEALLSLLYGVLQRKGFMVVAGDIGSGKTTLCRQFLKEVAPEVKTAVVLNPNSSAKHLLASICRDFGIECHGTSKKDYFTALEQFLLAGLEHNQNACLIIDEAQAMNLRLLEEIRMLSNLETAKQKLIQIILIGQPELRAILQKSRLTQLRQRIGVYIQLKGMNAQDTRGYIEHRLKIASEGPEQASFSNVALERIYEKSKGIPRLINTLCDRMLLAAYSRQSKIISEEIAEEALTELAYIC